MSNINLMIRRYSLIIFTIILFGCDTPPPETKEAVAPVKAIQYQVIKPQTILQHRKLSGYISSVNQSKLSFKVQGQLTQIYVEVGDSVTEGQPIAAIDATPFQHKLAQAKAELASANAGFKERSENYQRQQKIFKKQLINKNSMDKAQADFDQAQSLVLLAQAKVSLSQRDLKNTVLRAPFNGVITQRKVAQFEEINIRQVIMEIQDPNQLEVNFLVPSSLVDALKQTDAVSIDIPSAKVRKQLARINKIGIKTEIRGAYPFSAKLAKSNDQIHSGMAADIFIKITHQRLGVILPESAVVMAPNGDEHVYLYDDKTQQVFPRKVSTSLLNANQLLISSGLNAQDIVCTTGAEFLRKGQHVTLYQAKY